MKQALQLAALAACIILGSPARADNVDATDPGKLASIIRDIGYKASVEPDNTGDPMIVSSAGGTDFHIYFFGCTDGAACRSLLFSIGYDLENGTTADVIEDWNETVLFGRAYLDEEADPWLEMPVNLFGGISRENFVDTFDWWETVLDGFATHIGF